MMREDKAQHRAALPFNVGDVFWMNELVMSSNTKLQRTSPFPSNGGKRPCLCVHCDHQFAVFVTLTLSSRMEKRLLIEPKWRRGGGWSWMHGPIYLNDGANTYRGPHAAFEGAFCGNNIRPVRCGWITPEGMTRILEEIERRRWPRAS